MGAAIKSLKIWRNAPMSSAVLRDSTFALAVLVGTLTGAISEAAGIPPTTCLAFVVAVEVATGLGAARLRKA